MKLGIVLMASGFGKRFGSNKLLYPIDGKPLYMHVLESLICAKEYLSPDIQVQIVVVSQYPEIINEVQNQSETQSRSETQNRNIQAVYNPDSLQGITASIKLGIASLPNDTAYYGFFVADQPSINANIIEVWIRQFLASGKGIGCVSAGGNPGNPVIFSQKYLPELLALQGDKGGKSIVMAHLDDTLQYPVEERVLVDIDQLDDISRVKKIRRN